MKRLLALMIACCALVAAAPPSHAVNIIDEWNDVKIPPAPVLKPLSVTAGTTALLLLDFNKQTCNAERRPRCIAQIPAMATFLAFARSQGLPVIYSISSGASPADIAKELAPGGSEPIVTSGPDKFLGTELEKILKDRGVKTVIVAGTAANGAVLYTASAAALRGFQVVAAVDGISAQNIYAEQFVVWQLLNAPIISTAVTITKTDLISIKKP